MSQHTEQRHPLTVVTGAAGFLGLHTCRALLQAGHPVRAIDDYSAGRKEGLETLQREYPGLEIRQADVRDLRRLRPLFAGASWVVHLAGRPSVSASVVDPGRSHAINLEGTLNALEAARAARVRRVVYASSAAVYGDRPEAQLDETLRPRPRSPLAVQALAAERYCQLYAELYGLGTVCLRLFNVYGPGQDGTGDHSGVVARFVHRLVRGQELVLCGTGLQRRDLLHVDDAVEGILAALQAEGAGGRIFNIGSGAAVNLHELWQLIAGLSVRGGLPVTEDWFPSPGELGPCKALRRCPPRLGDLRRLCASTQRAKRVLAWQPCIGLREGLLSTIEASRRLQGPRLATRASVSALTPRAALARGAEGSP